MNEVESNALNEMMNALGGLYAHLGMVMRDESPNTSAMSWWANGEKKLIDRFAGYSLSREQCLAIYEAMQKVFNAE